MRHSVVPMTELTPQAATDFVHAAVPAIGKLGVEVAAIEPGSVTLRLPFEPNRNHMGTLYAGALFALAELPGGLLPLAVLDPASYTPIVTRVEIDFLAAARSDVTLTAHLSVQRLQELAREADAEGGAGFTLDLHGEDAGGRTVLRSHADYLLRSNRR
jgi:acyl-coenzyme A thioesterase PaaI-like protein